MDLIGGNYGNNSCTETPSMEIEIKSKIKTKIDRAKYKLRTRYQRDHDSNYVMQTFYSVYSCKSAWYFRERGWNTNELEDVNGTYVIRLPVIYFP